MELLAADRLTEPRRRTPSRTDTRTHRDDSLERVLHLQRTAGNRAVTGLLQPSSGAAMLQRQATPTATELVGPVPMPFEGAVSSNLYEQQPAALRTVIDASAKDGSIWWIKLGRDERFAVASLYNRFQSLGIWGYVRRIKSVKRGEPPWCGFWVSGDTASVNFEGDASGLMTALLASHRFCYDAGLGGSLHPGQHSHREISTADSLHVSVGKGRNDFDAHIDRYASPKGKKGIECVYDPTRTAAHQGREVIPAMVRKRRKLWGIPVFPGIGGFEVFPEDPAAPARPEMFEPTERDKAPPPAVGVTWRF